MAADSEAMRIDEVCEVSSKPENNWKMKSKMLDRVARSHAHFKSQQIGDPDLTYKEKRQIASDVLDQSPIRFLSRFHKFLVSEDLSFFHPFRGDYEVDFYLRSVSSSKDDEMRRKVRVKNRRYKALRQLVDEGDYFSDVEMKKRNPLLFEQMVGQYMTEEEKEQMESIDKSDLRFSTILLQHIDMTNTRKLQEIQYEREDDQFEESDDDESDENEDYTMNSEETQNSKISDEEKHMFREEFVSNMHQCFLLGNDHDFDYSTVDDNEDYDDIECDGDMEASYFDSEEPSREMATDSTDFEY